MAKAVQHVIAKRSGITALGKSFSKGDAIVHLSSERSTGETFILLPSELERVLKKKPATRWRSAKPRPGDRKDGKCRRAIRNGVVVAVKSD